MDAFLHVALSFPTLVFSVLLTVAMIYWLLAVLGLIEVELNGADAVLSHDGGAHPEAIAGLLMKFGLGGVPVSLVGTVLIFLAWLFCYFADLLVLQPLTGGVVHGLLGSAVAAAALLAAIPATAALLRPLRRAFAKLRQSHQRSVIGQIAIVRSPEVTEQRGNAAVDDGGAGLILQVRSNGGRCYRRGDRVVLLEYRPDQHAYHVIAETEFKGF